MSNPLKDHNFAKITMKNIMKNFQKEQIRQQHHQIRMGRYPNEWIRQTFKLRSLKINFRRSFGSGSFSERPVFILFITVINSGNLFPVLVIEQRVSWN